MAQITLSIPDEKVDEFLTAFVADQPIPFDLDGPTYSPGQWFKHWLTMKAFYAYKRGKRKLATVEIDEDIIT